MGCKKKSVSPHLNSLGVSFEFLGTRVKILWSLFFHCHAESNADIDQETVLMGMTRYALLGPLDRCLDLMRGF